MPSCICVCLCLMFGIVLRQQCDAIATTAGKNPTASINKACEQQRNATASHSRFCSGIRLYPEHRVAYLIKDGTGKWNKYDMTVTMASSMRCDCFNFPCAGRLPSFLSFFVVVVAGSCFPCDAIDASPLPCSQKLCSEMSNTRLVDSEQRAWWLRMVVERVAGPTRSQTPSAHQQRQAASHTTVGHRTKTGRIKICIVEFIGGK